MVSELKPVFIRLDLIHNLLTLLKFMHSVSDIYRVILSSVAGYSGAFGKFRL